MTINTRLVLSSRSRPRIVLKTIAYAASMATNVVMQTELTVTIALLSAQRGTGRSSRTDRRLCSVGCVGSPVGLSV